MSAPAFKRLVARARSDPNILAFWLGGSRGKGRPTAHSDCDCLMIVADEVLSAYRDRFQCLGRDGIDCLVMTLAGFEAYADWNGPQRWDRYSFAHGCSPMVDKTGEMQNLVDAKACVPKGAAKAFIDASLDHFINQLYRAAKCRRDGDALAARLEAVGAIEPLLDLLFVLDGRRVRPFAKYLTWELNTHPLTSSPWSAARLTTMVLRILDSGDLESLQEFLTKIEPILRKEGHGAVFDGWGETLAWMRSFQPR